VEMYLGIKKSDIFVMNVLIGETINNTIQSQTVSLIFKNLGYCHSRNIKQQIFDICVLLF